MKAKIVQKKNLATKSGKIKLIKKEVKANPRRAKYTA